MKHVLKIFSLLVVISALWVDLLQASIIPRSHTWLLPIYFIVSLGCYGLLMVGVGLMRFPTFPQEALLLQQAGNIYCGWDLNYLLIWRFHNMWFVYRTLLKPRTF